MPDIGNFQVPADDVGRAKRFHTSLLGWRIEPTLGPPGPAGVAARFQEIVTGETREETLKSGLMYRRQTSEQIVNHVGWGRGDAVLANVERLGGEIVMPKRGIPSVGLNAMIRDTEGTITGLWQPEGR